MRNPMRRGEVLSGLERARIVTERRGMAGRLFDGGSNG